MARSSRAMLVVLSAAVVGQSPQLGTLAPFVVGALLVAATGIAMQWRLRRSGPEALGPSRFVTPLLASWLVVVLLPVHKLSHRGYAPDGPRLGLESLIEVTAFALVAVVALAVIRSLEPSLSAWRPPVVLFLLPAWTATSALWSPFGSYAFVRGGQMGVTALLAWASFALGRASRPALADLVEGTFRWFVRLTLLLVAAGIAFGPVYVSASEANLERFTWIGAHPLAAGLVLSVALVIVAASPAPVLRLHPLVRLGAGLVFAVALIPNQSRQSWLGLFVVFAAALALAGRLAPLFRWLGGPLLGVAAVAGVLYRGPEIWSYVLRSGDSGTLASGNGRLALWSISLRALDTPFEWLAGLGHGFARTLFVAEEPWAHSAHSSFLAVLVGTGLIGMGLFLAVLLTAVRRILGMRLWSQSSWGFTLTLLFVLVLLNGFVTDNLAEPNLGFAMLYLIVACASVAPAHLDSIRGRVTGVRF